MTEKTNKTTEKSPAIKIAEESSKSSQKRKSIFETLSQIDISNYVEKKNGRKPLTYLSWANAWGLVKKYYPQANYRIEEFPEYIRTQDGWKPTGRQVDYRQTDAGYEVEATVVIEDEQYNSKLFVMDNRYNAIRNNASYFDINKTQQRALVKALAFAGLGLSIYAGEDLVEEPQKSTANNQKKQATQSAPRRLTNAELKKYTVTINGKTGLLLALFKNAVKGVASANDWLAKQHDPQTTMAINQLRSYYTAMEKDKKKKQAEEKRQQSLNEATAKIENSNTATQQSEPIDPTMPPDNAPVEQNESIFDDSEDVFQALDKYADDK